MYGSGLIVKIIVKATKCCRRFVVQHNLPVFRLETVIFNHAVNMVLVRGSSDNSRFLRGYSNNSGN